MASTAMMPTQASPNSVNAQKLRMHATRLKNRLFTAGTPCQCTKAGACQKAMDIGKEQLSQALRPNSKIADTYRQELMKLVDITGKSWDNPQAMWRDIQVIDKELRTKLTQLENIASGKTAAHGAAQCGKRSAGIGREHHFITRIEQRVARAERDRRADFVQHLDRGAADVLVVVAQQSRREDGQGRQAARSHRCRSVLAAQDAAQVVVRGGAEDGGDNVVARALGGHLTSAYQPIVNLLRNRVIGYEALTRFDDGTRQQHDHSRSACHDE
mgnify:CR=1 FL=1